MARPSVIDPFVECRARIAAALGRLASVGSAEAIRAAAPREFAEACGLTRAMISAVRGSRWVPLQLYTRNDLDPAAAAFRSYVESDPEIPLANMFAETDVVRRRTAMLVDEHLVGTRAFKPIIEIARSPAYVAAPIMVEGRTIGFMHADRVGQGRHVDEDDRRYIQAFTAELAVVYQRARWSERLSERARRALIELERAQEALAVTEPVLDLPIVPESPRAVHPDPDIVGGTLRKKEFLTEREYEVLDHIANGATNRVIAQRLSLSEDTVKTHIRSVLRKLRVTSRGAAVARYLEFGGGIR
jgi:DNA-binding CsgD family transcriptional regulator